MATIMQVLKPADTEHLLQTKEYKHGGNIYANLGQHGGVWVAVAVVLPTPFSTNRSPKSGSDCRIFDAQHVLEKCSVGKHKNILFDHFHYLSSHFNNVIKICR